MRAGPQSLVNLVSPFSGSHWPWSGGLGAPLGRGWGREEGPGSQPHLGVLLVSPVKKYLQHLCPLSKAALEPRRPVISPGVTVLSPGATIRVHPGRGQRRSSHPASASSSDWSVVLGGQSGRAMPCLPLLLLPLPPARMWELSLSLTRRIPVLTRAGLKPWLEAGRAGGKEAGGGQGEGMTAGTWPRPCPGCPT